MNESTHVAPKTERFVLRDIMGEIISSQTRTSLEVFLHGVLLPASLCLDPAIVDLEEVDHCGLFPPSCGNQVGCVPHLWSLRWFVLPDPCITTLKEAAG